MRKHPQSLIYYVQYDGTSWNNDGTTFFFSRV